jgi:hypothetical protein
MHGDPSNRAERRALGKSRMPSAGSFDGAKRIVKKTKCVKIRLKQGCREHVRAWATEVNARSDEALATLRDEGVFIESAFLDSTGEGDFLIYYMRAKSFEHAHEISSKSLHPIDAYHKQFKEDCWAERRHLEALIDLTNHHANESNHTAQPDAPHGLPSRL